jgi:hypothetical protein
MGKIEKGVRIVCQECARPSYMTTAEATVAELLENADALKPIGETPPIECSDSMPACIACGCSTYLVEGTDIPLVASAPATDADTICDATVEELTKTAPAATDDKDKTIAHLQAHVTELNTVIAKAFIADTSPIHGHGPAAKILRPYVND